jgi:hypothetical protein
LRGLDRSAEEPTTGVHRREKATTIADDGTSRERYDSRRGVESTGGTGPIEAADVVAASGLGHLL